MVVPQTKEWIADIVQQFRAAEDMWSLLNLGVDYLRCQYVPEVIRACWPEFAACMAKHAPNDNGLTVVVVDFPAVFHAAWSKSPDSPSEVTTDVIARLDSIYEDTACEDRKRFLLATDGENNWRKQKFPGYKGSRPAKPAGFKEALEDSITAAIDRKFNVLQFPEYESDDIVASVSYRAKLRRQNAILVTDDRDSWQCLGMGTVMYSPRTKSYFNEDRLAAEVQITPKQAVDWLCMVGKDDVPCAKGIGEKTASQLLATYGSFCGIFDNQEALKPAKATGIDEFAKGDYWLARELHTLCKALEVRW